MALTSRVIQKNIPDISALLVYFPNNEAIQIQQGEYVLVLQGSQADSSGIWEIV